MCKYLFRSVVSQWVLPLKIKNKLQKKTDMYKYEEMYTVHGNVKKKKTTFGDYENRSSFH